MDAETVRWIICENIVRLDTMLKLEADAGRRQEIERQLSAQKMQLTQLDRTALP